MSFALGQIFLFAGNKSPKYWTFCHGQALSIKEYEPLYSLLGTTYGGDGRNLFHLPDLRGRVPIHKNEDPEINEKFPAIPIGKSAGTENVTLDVSNLPPHVHTLQPKLQFNDVFADETNPSGGSLAAGEVAMYITTSKVFEGRTFNKNAISVITEKTGSGEPFNIRQPYLGMNYIIKVTE